MGRIESYYIYTWDGLENEKRFELYVELYEKILHKDDKWHYFTEGNYDELRFHSKYKGRVDKFLSSDKRIARFTHRKGGWVDDQASVERFKEYFTEIFHQNSVIAIEIYKEEKRNVFDDRDLQLFIDRVVHSFFNMRYLYTNTFREEEKIMANYVIDRAFYNGRNYQYNLMKEKKNDE